MIAKSDYVKISVDDKMKWTGVLLDMMESRDCLGRKKENDEDVGLKGLRDAINDYVKKLEVGMEMSTKDACLEFERKGMEGKYGKVVLRILACNSPGVKVGIDKWRVFENGLDWDGKVKKTWVYDGMLGKREAFGNKEEVGLLLFDSWEEAAIWCDCAGLEYIVVKEDGVDGKVKIVKWLDEKKDKF